jgi:hypothetical protein
MTTCCVLSADLGVGEESNQTQSLSPRAHVLVTCSHIDKKSGKDRVTQMA